MVRPGPVTVGGGSGQADMTEYALAEREHLVLKPTALHSGAGGIQGWLTGTDGWRRQLPGAMNGPYVLQRGILPLAEPFPAESGPQPWVLWWGAFLGTAGYGGALFPGHHHAAPREQNHRPPPPPHRSRSPRRATSVAGPRDAR